MFGVCGRYSSSLSMQRPHDAFPAEFLGLLDPVFRNEGLETGFYDFDKITTGFQPGELIILAARPGMGKTALALNMATYAATTTDKAIAIFNLEMPAEQLQEAFQ